MAGRGLLLLHFLVPDAGLWFWIVAQYTPGRLGSGRFRLGDRGGVNPAGIQARATGTTTAHLCHGPDSR